MIVCARSMVFFLFIFSSTNFNSLRQFFSALRCKANHEQRPISFYFIFFLLALRLYVMFMVFYCDLIFRMTSFQCDLSICTNVWNKRFLENPHTTPIRTKQNKKKNNRLTILLWLWFGCMPFGVSYPIGMNDVSSTEFEFCGNEMIYLYVNDVWMILLCGGFYALCMRILWMQ